MDKYRGRHWETELASGEPSDNKVSGERKKKSFLGFGGGSYQTVVTVEEEIKNKGGGAGILLGCCTKVDRDEGKGRREV